MITVAPISATQTMVRSLSGNGKYNSGTVRSGANCDAPTITPSTPADAPTSGTSAPVIASPAAQRMTYVTAPAMPHRR